MLRSFALTMALISSAPVFVGAEPPAGAQQLDTGVQKKGEISLESTLEKTYMNNAELDAARAALRAQDENVAQAVSEWRPSLSVRGTHQNSDQYSSPNAIGGTNTSLNRNTQSVQAQVRQNVFAGGGTLARTDQARQGVFAQRENLVNTEQNVLFGGVQAHMGVITQAKILELRRQREDFLKQTVERAQARFEVGEITRTEVEAAKAEYMGSQAERVQAEAELESAYATYLKQTGTPAQSLSEPHLYNDLPKTLDESIRIAESSSPSVRQATFNIRAAEAEVRSQESGLLPTVDLSMSTSASQSSGNRPGRSGFGGAMRQSRSNDVAFVTEVNVPLYSQGITRSRVRQALQNLGRAKVDKVNQERTAREFATQAWERLIAAKEAVIALVAQVEAQKIAVEGVTEEANVGQKTILDILQEAQNLINAQVNLAQAKRTEVESSYQVLAAIGALRAENLGLDVEYYDAEAYYEDFSTAAFQFWEGDDRRYVKDGV